MTILMYVCLCAKFKTKEHLSIYTVRMFMTLPEIQLPCKLHTDIHIVFVSGRICLYDVTVL